MSRPHIYTVHINPSQTDPYENAKFVEEGFNWPALFFTGLWSLYKKLWLITVLIILLNVFVINIANSGAIADIGIVIIQLVIQIAIGMFANDLYRAKLKRQGYIIADIVSGDSLLRAEQRFFDRYFLSHAQAPFSA